METKYAALVDLCQAMESFAKSTHGQLVSYQNSETPTLDISTPIKHCQVLTEDRSSCQAHQNPPMNMLENLLQLLAHLRNVCISSTL